MIWYKAMLTIETLTIWALMRKHGYFKGLTANPKSIMRKVETYRDSSQQPVEIEEKKTPPNTSGGVFYLVIVSAFLRLHFQQVNPCPR